MDAVIKSLKTGKAPGKECEDDIRSEMLKAQQTWASARCLTRVCEMACRTG